MSLTTDYYIDREQKAQAFEQRALTNYLPLLRLLRAHLLVMKDTKDLTLVDDILEIIDGELVYE